MSTYHHLNTFERDCILILHNQGKSLRYIAKYLHRSPSTIAREFRRNRGTLKTRKPIIFGPYKLYRDSKAIYSPVTAQIKYGIRRKRCGMKSIFKTNRKLRDLVKRLIVDFQWSPQQICGRLAYEQNIHISYNTIYRSIYRGEFEVNCRKLIKKKGFEKHLRRKGRAYRRNRQELRGQFQIAKTIHERPKAANDRSEPGHMECDTVQGKGQSGLVLTMTDRKSRYLIVKRLGAKSAENVNKAILEIMEMIEIKSITSDRGKEFSGYNEIVNKTGVEVYFADAGKPWQRGTNENTNGLLREYMPKGKSFTIYTKTAIEEYERKINMRPRKVLGWKTPYEIFFDKVLHLT